MQPILFYLFGGLALATALGVIVFKNPISSAFSLIVSFFAMAGLYAMLDAHFLAIIQILVYAGAIMVLFIFVIMLLNLQGDELKERPFHPYFKGLAALLLLGFGGVLYLVLGPMNTSMREVGDGFGSIKEVGTELFTRYWFAFEYTSILLLVALIGGVVLAKRELKP